MTAFEPTLQARTAARRAEVLAGIARRRAPFTPARTGRALLSIADLLDIVVLSLHTEAPATGDRIPEGARLALADAESEAAATPGTGFPHLFGQYITHAVDRRALQLPVPLGLASDDLADRDAQLAAALDIVHGHLTAAATECVAQALLEAVFALHEERAQLAKV